MKKAESIDAWSFRNIKHFSVAALVNRTLIKQKEWCQRPPRYTNIMRNKASRPENMKNKYYENMSKSTALKNYSRLLKRRTSKNRVSFNEK